MLIDLENIPCFGVAGNFTGHLEQAGEAADFVNVKAEAGAPKALFPTYIPFVKENDCETLCCTEPKTPSFLHVFPFDSTCIKYPKGEQKLQIEPECAIICDVSWDENKVTALVPKFFGASNDCSIRKEGAKKISLKKNWGSSSKGLSDVLLPIDSFSETGKINDFRIASFLLRDGTAYAYGEDSAIKDYSYIYEKLLTWIIDKLNNQCEEGPAEKVNDYLQEAGFPKQIMISIGATRYTDFGEHNFLQTGDKSVVVVYSQKHYNFEQIKNFVENGQSDLENMSVLCQLIKEN